MDNEKYVIFTIHGYMSLKKDMQIIADTLTQAGYKVHNADMAGHDCGTEKLEEDKFMQTFWDDWFTSVEEQFISYKEQGFKIILIGHSMGGLIALNLAEKYSQIVSGIICLATPIYFNSLYPLEINNGLVPLTYIGHHFVKRIERDKLNFIKRFKSNSKSALKRYYYPPQLVTLFKSASRIRRNLKKVIAPLLCIQAFNDKYVPDSCPFEITQKAGSKKSSVKMYTIEEKNSGRHDIMLHPETQEKIHRDILEFVGEIISVH